MTFKKEIDLDSDDLRSVKAALDASDVELTKDYWDEQNKWLADQQEKAAAKMKKMRN